MYIYNTIYIYNMYIVRIYVYMYIVRIICIMYDHIMITYLCTWTQYIVTHYQCQVKD